MTAPQPEDRDIASVAAEEKTSELTILKQSLEEAKAKSAEYYDQLVRLKAEFENYRKRVEKEKGDHRRWGKEEIVMQLISLMDVMEQAEAAAHKTHDVKSVIVGLDMLYGEFKRLLREEGLEEIAAEGEKFDPERHEAVETVEGDGDEGRVLAVLQKGYSLKGRLLRPARVKVAARPSGVKGRPAAG